jgi:hypothetical protein
MEKPHPIRLPHELEKEAEDSRLQVIQERIVNDRKNVILLTIIIEFLKTFEIKIVEFNHYMQLYTPYPTISQMTKDNVRNKLRALNDFYFSYSGSNPHPLICECMEYSTLDAEKLHMLYKKLGDLVTKLNNNVSCISNKQILFIAKRKPKEETYDWNEYDWT